MYTISVKHALWLSSAAMVATGGFAAFGQGIFSSESGRVVTPTADRATSASTPKASAAYPIERSVATEFDPEASGCSYPTTDVVYWNVAQMFGGIDQAKIASAVSQANAEFASHPDRTVVLQFDAGTWSIGGNGQAAISVNGLNKTRQADDGWLVFQGAGMQNTTLVFNEQMERGFQGTDVYRLQICDMHLTRSEETVSQGEVIGFLQGAQWSADPDPAVFGDQTLTRPGILRTDGYQSRFLVVRLHSGFPDINAIYNPSFGQGRYIRRYGYSGSQPYLIQDSNKQTGWSQKDQLANGDWVLGLIGTTSTYSVGDQIGIKSKKAGEPIWLARGGKIRVENVRFTRASRLLLRGGIDDIRFSNIAMERMPAIGGRVPFLSTAEGGPQLGQPGEGPLTNVHIESAFIEGVGDDAIGAFDVTGLTVTGSTFVDSFARGLLLDATSTTPCIHDSLLDRNPLLPENTSFLFGCVTDATAPSALTGLAASAGTGVVSLTWTASAATDLDGYVVVRTPAGGTPVEIANGVQSNGYQDISAVPGIQYSYVVRAIDTSRNTSAASSSVTVTAL